MRGPESFIGDDLDNINPFEKEPIFVSSLFVKSEGVNNNIFTYKGTDPNIDLGAVYNLYVGSCLEKGEEPMSIEDVSMSMVNDFIN